MRIAGVSPAEQETCSLFRLIFKPASLSSRPPASFDAGRIESSISPVQSFGKATIQPARHCPPTFRGLQSVVALPVALSSDGAASAAVTLASAGRRISFSWCVQQEGMVTRIVRIERIDTDKEHID